MQMNKKEIFQYYYKALQENERPKTNNIISFFNPNSITNIVFYQRTELILKDKSVYLNVLKLIGYPY